MRTLTYDGRTLTIAQWAKRTNQTAATLRWRLDNGWPIEQALHNPLRGYKPINQAEEQAREANLRAAKMEREFMKLVTEIDNALCAFNTKLGWLLGDTPGVGQNISKNANDRCPRVAQESV
jgi:hypothetical protein